MNHSLGSCSVQLALYLNGTEALNVIRVGGEIGVILKLNRELKISRWFE